MQGVKITILPQEMDRFFTNIDKYNKMVQDKVKKEVVRTTYAIDSQAKKNAPVKFGRLRAGITPTIKNNGVTGVVSVNVGYGIFVHEGTKPHQILPRNRKMLAWSTMLSGRSTKYNRFARRVMHPGTKANLFLKKAADFEKPRFVNNLNMIFR